MAGSIDYARLREQTMGSGLDEEAVTVNTRALIDKVLARYSGEWTTLRELIQNAADASATKVTIRFETIPSSTVPAPQADDPASQIKHTLLHHTLSRLLVSNNGEAFGENDWSRLKRIAEGNPDETKIGAFGVGFYSVFADCENPFVSSGDETMAFYWKGNSLFTRRGRLPKENAGSDTTFMLDYRNTTSPVPALLSLCQFLSTSLTFVGLECIELWLDQWNILELTKKTAPSADMSIPSDVSPKTKDGLMKIVGVEYQNAQIDAKWMNVVGWTKTSGSSLTTTQQASDTGPPAQSLRSFFSRFTSSGSNNTAASKRAAKEEEAVQRAIAEDLAGTSTATVFLRISTVNVQTYVPKALAAELERATKKPPPKHTRIAILTSSYDETSASLSTVSGLGSGKAADIFASVLPTKNGRIFIGFPTAQTTGLLAHISAPSVIPTVERESIDLNARYVRSWNVEMLRVAGIACRVAYTGEMAQLKAKLARQMSTSRNKKVQKEDLDAIMPAAIHAFKQYTYHDSTPSSQVGQIIEEAFWTCNQKASIDILSTRGVLPSFDVRLATEDLSFVEGIPVIPDLVVEKAPDFLNKLQEFGLLSEITTRDIKKELERQALTETQLAELLKWAAKKLELDQLDSSAIHSLFDGTVATIAEEHASTYAGPVLLLGGIDTFPNVTKVPAELPMPPSTIPFRFIKGIPKNQLETFGWSELQIVPWLRYLIEKDGTGLSPDMSLTKSPAFAAQILPVLSKSWESLSQSSKSTVADLLSTRPVIPTKLGMRKPAQAYFASVKLFDDLPTVQGLQSVKEKFLAAIGVRKTVELSVVFARLMAKSTGEKGASESKWSHVDLIKYLVSVRDDIPNEDINKLRKTPICPAEQPGTGKSTSRLYRVDELFEPKQPLRDLGLTLLNWPEAFRPGSPEAKFLLFLGLRPYPEVPDLVQIIANAATSGNTALYETAMRYFVVNHYPNGYRRFNMLSIEVAFLPVMGEDLSKLATPRQCFVNKGSAVLGFKILREDLHPHALNLGVEQDPPIAICGDRLVRKPPLSRADAKTVFGYFAGRLNEIGASGNLAEKLGEAPIIPITKPPASANGPLPEKDYKAPVRFVAPRSCFLGDSQTYGEIFDFVDFGSEANSFLLKVGSKHEPSAIELAGMLVREPVRLLNTLGSDKYLSLLRRIADNAAGLKTDKTLWANLKRAPCLLACREVSSISTEPGEDGDRDGDEESSIREYSLATATSMILADDFGSYRLFKNKLLAAPDEEVLENFYFSLGTPWLSSIVEDDQRMGPLLKDQTSAQTLLKLIIERCRLFLHDHTTDVIRHDARWLEKSLTVQATSSLTLRRSLRGYNVSYTEKKTAALHRETKKDATLFVTARPDLYEVSRALMSVLLKRPKQQDFLALEMIMEADLRRLKTRGYNVDRILRQKAAESRIAEMERQKQLEQEQKHLAEQEERHRLTEAAKGIEEHKAAGVTPERSKAIPGAFDESPGEPSPPGAVGLPMRNKKGFLSSLGKQLGFNGNDQAVQQQLRDMAQGGSRAITEGSSGPPPYAIQDPNTKSTSQPSQVTPPHDLQQNMVSAIQSSRAHDSSTLFSPPSTKEIKENATYCDAAPGQDLVFVADSRPGIKIFLNSSVPAEQRTAFLQANSAALNAFAFLLLDCSNIFLLKPQSMHLFYNEAGNAIAFNRSGSIFCNLRFFLQLHWSKWNADGGEGKREAAVYWWVTLCHELAHNLVQDHGSQHEYYTESFITQYFPKIVAKVAQYGNEVQRA